ncbi:S-formylglutathione hydrolase FrmB [Arthrobacter sp. V4I6]|uniref:alpha/beta hydrolase n=1 Tax=unclassified Arthrobacter TaxID=235627 RepID=UPI00277D4ED7|nr:MULTISPECIES: alpha/beta hydrolase-fold protein [unclassified Arthrobacter]MDQ0820312.1 S-formylglutathione hydrolase FrmB [Arthrobacter sp. V1I7]MDQ0854494.1 S-formylglutathione hydrolase FrmB [Arthrobacter sp. V4I6]
MDFLEDIRLVDGPVLWIAWAAGAAGLAYLLWWRDGASRLQRVLRSGAAAVLSALLAAALVAGGHWLLIYVFSAFPEVLPREVLAWTVPAVAALLLLILRLKGIWGAKRPARPWRKTAAATVAVLGMVTLSAVQINDYFGLNHTVSDLTGTAVARIQPLEDGLKRASGAAPGVSLAGWTAPAGLPDGGELRRASIPGTNSGFQSREAYIYLPPAYQASPRPALPVLVLFSGQPGAPADWLTGGALRSRMDRFAAAHHGVAPVVVVVDPNGSTSGNTMCLDSRIAQADTFLSQDVPAWIDRTLAVDPDRRQWAAGGFSFGGTCAVQMVTRHPEIYSSALAFSSEQEPAIAKEREKTIEASFGGDTEAFERLTPLRLMAERRFEGNGIYFAAGVRDPEFMGYLDVLSAAARDAGFSVETRSIDNAGHSWLAASSGLPGGLDFLAARWGIRP